MGEATSFCALVHRSNCSLPQSPEAHRRDVEHRSRVRLRALLATDDDSEVGFWILNHRAGRDGVTQPAVARLVDIMLGPKRFLVCDVLGALIDHRPGVS